MNAYTESKNKIDAIRNKYSCSGDLIFRSAIYNVVGYGTATILDNAWYECTMDDIDANHDAAKKEGKTLFITREFEKAIVDCSRELAEINTHDFLIYIQKEIWLGGEGISYKRAIELLKNYINTLDFNYSPLDAMREIGFTDNEIEELGFGFLLEEDITDVLPEDNDEETKTRYYVCGIGYDENENITDHELSFGDFDTYEEAYECFVKVQCSSPESLFAHKFASYQMIVQLEECEETEDEINCIDVKNEWWIINPNFNTCVLLDAVEEE